MFMLSLSRSVSLRVAVALLAAHSIIPCVLAQSPSSPSAPLFSPKVTEQLTSGLTALMHKDNLPSVEVSIERPHKGSYSFVGGSANLESSVPRRPNEPFRIASITKPFAAVAILTLVDSKDLHTADTISTWYPDFPNASTITIGDLLKMRSGIPAPNDDEVLARVYDAPLAAPTSFDEEMKTYVALRDKFKQPDSVGVYTDFNYDILAAIVEKVYHHDIGTLITRSVMEPLSLTHSSYPVGTDVPGKLRGYGINPSTQKFEDKTLFNPPLAGAAGAVISNAHDMHIFTRALCRGTLLKPDTFRFQMDAKPLVGANASYGAGVATGSGVCGHSGTINGFSSDMYYFEKLDTTVVVSVTRLDRDNHSRSAAVLELVAHTMLAALTPAP